MDEIALFAGAGGGLLGTHHLLGWRTVCAVEIEPYRRDVLGARQRDGFLGPCPFPIHSDIRDFDGIAWRGRVDVVTAGFPCQPFSGAGKRLGADDPRNMWTDTARVIREVRPRYVLLENSPKLASYPPRLAVVVALLDLLGGKKRRRVEHLFNPGGYLGTVLGDLAESGYDAEWDCFPASAIGAPHRRDRLWILAYAPEARPGRGGRSSANDVADADEERRVRRSALGPGREGREPAGIEPVKGSRGWPPEPRLGRIAPHGMADRLVRVKAIGDGQVPGVAALAWTALARRAGILSAAP